MTLEQFIEHRNYQEFVASHREDVRAAYRDFLASDLPDDPTPTLDPIAASGACEPVTLHSVPSEATEVRFSGL